MLNPTGLGLMAAALSASVIVGPAAWFGRGIIFDHYERPAIIEGATDRANDAATIRIMDAANRAEIAATERQRARDAEAIRIYRDALNNSERVALEAQTRLEQETAAYETELAAEGRADPVTQRDLDWVRGLGTSSGPDSSR